MSTLATYKPNRIEYIALGNPSGAGSLVERYGYRAPEDPLELVKLLKLLVRKRGRTVIEDLLRIHPEKEAILKVHGYSSFDAPCGCNSSYDPAEAPTAPEPEDEKKVFKIQREWALVGLALVAGILIGSVKLAN